MIEDLEDEDIILENSPLNQYLSSINLINTDIHEKNETNIKANKLDYSLFHFLTFDWLVKRQLFIKQKLLDNQILSILKSADSVNILNETDDMHLQYLINSRFIHQDAYSTKRSILSNWKTVSSFIFVIGMIHLVFGKFISGLFLTLFVIAYLSILMVYGYFIRWLLTMFFQKLAILSMHSRQVILLIQELLSLNRGYSRLVHIKDSDVYDCSKSFNEEFLEKFCQHFFSTLTDLLSVVDKSNQLIINRNIKYLTCVKEVPWFSDDYVPYFDSYIETPNFKQPISSLKNLHNMIQLQFSELIKIIVMMIYSSDSHPRFYFLLDVIRLQYYFNKTQFELLRFKQILQIKTKSNLTDCNKKKETYQPVSDQIIPLVNSIQSFELHLFEISEFSSQFSQHVNHAGNLDGEPLTSWLSSQRHHLEKSKKHIDALQLCWSKILDDFNELCNSDNRDICEANKNFKALNCTENIDENGGSIVIDSNPIIVDEVIEGIPEDFTVYEHTYHPNQAVDPFEEKCMSNAKALLNELQSVIEIRAEDWKKREKVALERRAAEGKFVFDREQQNEEAKEKCSKDFVDNDTKNHNTDCDRSLSFENSDFSLDFRRSLGEMVLKQRQNFLDKSQNIGNTEECFGD